MLFLQLVAKVRIFLETTKLFGNYFSKKFFGRQTYSLTQLLTFDICI